MTVVACEIMVELFVYVCLILMREYNYKDYYELKFMRWKFYKLSEKLKLKIAR